MSEKEVLVEDVPTLDSKSISELKIRLGILDTIIREARADGDSRWKEPARQQRVINETLVRKIRERRHQKGEDEPVHVVVGVNPARMVAKSASPWDK